VGVSNFHQGTVVLVLELVLKVLDVVVKVELVDVVLLMDVVVLAVLEDLGSLGPYKNDPKKDVY